MLYIALIEHGVGHAFESRNICADNVITGITVFFSRFYAVAVDISHDLPQSVIYFIPGPLQFGTVLNHL